MLEAFTSLCENCMSSRNGIKLDYPADRPSARKRLGFAEEDFVVGFIGRLEPQKNPRRMARAFAIMGKEAVQICAHYRRARTLAGRNRRDAESRRPF